MLSLKKFLQIFDGYCKEHQISYAYARYYDAQIFEKTQNDIDIIITKSDIEFIKTLIQACPGLVLFDEINHPTNTQLYIYGIQQAGQTFFCLDLHHGLAFKGHSYLNLSAVLLRAVPAQCGIGQQPDPVDLGLIYVFTHLLKHHNASDKTRSVINMAIRSNRDGFLDLLEMHFGVDGYERLNRALNNPTARTLSALRRQYTIRALIRHGFWGLYLRSVHSIQTVWQRTFNRRDVRIVVLGTDGSGKTTFIQQFKQALVNIRPVIKHAHLLPVMPWQVEPDSILTNSNPHAQPNRSWFVSNCKIAYFYFLYWLDAVWPRRGYRLVIYDRYMLDILIDPRRFRYGGSSRFAKLLLRFLPKIHQHIWLDTPAVIAYKRKTEFPLAEVQRQYLGYKDFCQNEPDCVVVSGTAISEKNIQEAVQSLVANLAQRYGR